MKVKQWRLSAQQTECPKEGLRILIFHFFPFFSSRLPYFLFSALLAKVTETVSEKNQ